MVVTVLAAAWRDDCVCSLVGGEYVYPCGYRVLEDVAGLRATAARVREVAVEHGRLHEVGSGVERVEVIELRVCRHRRVVRVWDGDNGDEVPPWVCMDCQEELPMVETA